MQFKLFHPNGEPIRADVGLELAQAEKASTASASSAGEPQNPTTLAMRGMKVHTVADGDSLASIAYGAYGDPTRWRLIAEANGIDNPLHLAAEPPDDPGAGHMTPASATAELHVASYKVLLDGAESSASSMDALGEIKVVDTLMLPDTCDLTMFINSYDRTRRSRTSTISRSRSARRSRSRSAPSMTEPRRRPCSTARSSPSTPTSATVASRSGCAPTTAATS